MGCRISKDKLFHALETINFGCEFEFSEPIHEVAACIEDVVVDEYGYDNIKTTAYEKVSGNYSHWIVKPDSTTESELNTPISNISDIPKIKKVIKVLHDKKFITKRCDAFHVHTCCAGYNPLNLLTLWIAIEPAMARCFPVYRRNHDYAYAFYSMIKQNKRMRSQKLTDIIVKDSVLKRFYDHYGSISYSEGVPSRTNSTVEFRIAEGNTDVEFVENWINICLHMASMALYEQEYINHISERKFKAIIKFYEMLDILQIQANSKMGKWLEKRHTRFSGKPKR